MKKRILSGILALLLVVTLLPGTRAAEIVASGECGDQGDNVTWTLDSDGTLVISGTGEMADYLYNSSVYQTNTPWYERRKVIKRVIISNGVESVGNNAFVDCWNISDIVLPNSINSIGERAFFICKGLKSICIPESVTVIKELTFSNCESLENVSLPSHLKIIEDWAFMQCYKLSEIQLPEGLIEIGEGAFYNSGLCSITIPCSLTTIGNQLFYDCYSLTEAIILSEINILPCFSGCYKLTAVTMPESIRTISGGTFSDCSSLVSISLPDCLEYIGDYAFDHCSKLEKIYLSNSIVTVSPFAFDSCPLFTDVYYGGSQAEWEQITYRDNTGHFDFNPFQNLIIHYNHSHFLNTGTVTTPPTCTEPGVRTFTCACGETKTEPEPAPGHNFVNGVCTRCQELDPDYIPLSVVSLPAEVSALDGEEAVVTVQAAGNGLTYAWYVKAPGEAEFTLTDTTTAEYRITMSKARDGTQAYCVVTDAYRNTVQTGTVTLRLKPDHTPGDINGDGRVNNRDLTRLAQYLAGKDVECVEAALDVNGDGKVNNRDLTRLAQWLAGKEVELH